MIISKIQGGLGNQMFQYAYGRSLSLKYGQDLVLETSFYNIKSSVERFFTLDKFTNTKINLNITNNGNPTYLVRDNFNHFNLDVKPNSNYYLDGYWQSEKYFSEFEDQIREDFSPNQEILNKLLLTPFIDSTCVSLHIRRTDYISSNGYHPVQSIEYYQKALEIIGDYDKLFIFSDDIDWCRTNLKFKDMIFMQNFSDIEDIWIMSLCKHNIIANSTFSWWGGWLNKNENKKVIAPKNWFGQQAGLNTEDIIPKNWIKI